MRIIILLAVLVALGCGETEMQSESESNWVRKPKIVFAECWDGMDVVFKDKIVIEIISYDGLERIFRENCLIQDVRDQ